MIDNKPIHLNTTARIRWFHVLALIPILLVTLFNQNRFVSLYAFEIPLKPIAKSKFANPYPNVELAIIDLPIEVPMYPATISPYQPAPDTKIDPVSQSPKKPDEKFNPIILEAANRYKVEPAILKAIIMAESRFNPKAVSKRGAKGLMQLMPRTAKSLGVTDSFNPKENIHAGAKYFRRLLNRFNGNTHFALAAYNAGSRKVIKYNPHSGRIFMKIL